MDCEFSDNTSDDQNYLALVQFHKETFFASLPKQFPRPCGPLVKLRSLEARSNTPSCRHCSSFINTFKKICVCLILLRDLCPVREKEVEMKCAKLQLQERTKTGPKESTADGPRRYCQRRLVDPEQDLWRNYDRFNFNEDANFNGSFHNGRLRQGADDLYLSVQNLQFQGVEQQRKRPRTSFKYKTLPSRQHRMFVKELVEDNFDEGGRCSELTCYFYDDYAKYLINNDRSRPSSGKSSIFLFDAIENPKKNVEKNKVRTKTFKTAKSESNKKKPNEILNGDKKDLESRDKDTKISFHKSGKRKSLTISRADSPATLQVIRVDVVCNYSTSSISDYEDKKQTKSQEKVAKGDSHFTNKYLLTNTVKTLDENAGGARVTLLCKTFKLADRSGLFAENKAKSLKIRN